jgi:hypothetical protein
MAQIIDIKTINKLRAHIGGSSDLKPFAPYVPDAITLPDFPGERDFPRRDLAMWCRSKPYLAVVDHQQIGRVSFVLFRVHHHQRDRQDAVLQEMMIEILGMADSAISDGQQVVIEFQKPVDEDGLCYRHRFHELNGHRIDSVELFLTDILYRNQGFIERLMERIALIGHVLSTEEPQ